MKIITKCFTFALMIALILSITAISAQEDISFNQSDLKSIDDDSIKISLENSQQTTNEMENEEVTDTEDGSYSDLINEFKSYEGGQFTLSKKHYSYDSGNSIEINKTGAINGNGAIIDMAGSSVRTFKITAENVVIANLTIKNVINLEYGGAILFDKPGSVENCSFINNSALYGGSICFMADGNVSNCNFTDNRVTGDGGAIYYYTTDSRGTVKNSNFKNNSASNAGAIYFKGYRNVLNCIFINNSASNDAGALYFYKSPGLINECSFINNIASQGGAVYLYIASCTVADSNFTNNSASDFGGAFKFDSSDSKGNWTGCNFVNNSASSAGGAIYLPNKEESSTELFNCSFIANNADEGGALYIFNAKITNSKFIRNYASSNASVAYFDWEGDYGQSEVKTLNNNIFLNNSPGKEFYFQKSEGINMDYNWFGNTAEDYAVKPNEYCNVWLFINATVDPTSIVFLETSKIMFKMFSYNGARGIYDYDDILPSFVLQLTSNGFLDKDCIGLNEIATYTATTPGEGYVTAEIENVEYIIWFDIIKIRSGLSVDDKSIIYGENIALHFNYNSSATGLVNITLSGKKFNASFMNLNLNETIHLSGSILPDIYDVNVYYEGDGVFVNESARAMLIVSKSEPQIIASDLTVKYGSKISFIFNLKDSQGNAIMGADTVVVIGDKVYNQKTNKNGEVVLNPVLVPKTYIVTIMFDGNDEYDKTTSIAKVVVKKSTPKLTAKKKTFKAKTKTKKYFIILKTDQNKAMKKVKVYIKVKGKKYAAKTNSKGKAIFKIKNLKKKGTYKAKVTFKANQYFNKVAKTVKIKVKK